MIKTRDELEAENKQLQADVEEVVTIVYGVLNLLGFLQPDGKSIKPEFLEKDEHKKVPIAPYLIDNILSLGKLYAETQSKHPVRAEQAKKELAKMMWMVNNLDGMVARYSKYNRLKEKQAQIEAEA